MQSPYTCPFTILIDTNEGNPFTFDGLRCDSDKNYRPLHVPTQFASLGRRPHSLGDYSIAGFRENVAVERKGMEDAWGTILGWDSDYEQQKLSPGRRKRFESELSNLSKIDAAIVVVEASLGECLAQMPQWGERPAKWNAKIFYRTLLAYQQDYSVQWQFCDTRRLAEKYTFWFLHRFHRKYQERKRQQRKLLMEI